MAEGLHSRKPLTKDLGVAVLLGLGVLSAFYGISVWMIGTGSYFFCFWIALGAVLVGLALLWLNGTLAKVPRWAKAVLAVPLAAALVLFGVAFGAVLSHSSDEPPAGMDYLVVLGAQVTDHGPSGVLLLRLKAAVDYLEANPDTLCIVTGCQGPNEPWSEAEGMAAWLVEQGIDPARIILEDQAEDTFQNIAYSAQLMEEGASFAIVSNNFHIYRALAIAHHQGLDNVYGLSTSMRPYFYLNNAVREAIAIIAYKVLGRI